MTAKEIIQKHARNSGDYIPDYQFESLQKAMKEYALIIAEKAVESEKMKGLPDKPISYTRIHDRACENILSRIKTLTENEE